MWRMQPIIILLSLVPAIELAAAISYSETLAQHALNQSQASYCIADGDPWSCSTCNAGVELTAVIEQGGGRALVGYDSTQASLFVAYRGSSDIQNWIDNIRFLKTSPYEDMPDVSVEKGFYKWYTDLKDGVDAALQSASQTFNSNLVSVTGHSAGGAAATLHAFDIARGEAATAGWLSLKQVVTFGSPRVGDENFYEAHRSIINETAIPSWRVTHYHDLVPHVPMESLGYNHVSTEVYYDEPSTTYKVCDGSGEDDSCSNSCGYSCDSISDHLDYLNTPLGGDNC